MPRVLREHRLGCGLRVSVNTFFYDISLSFLLFGTLGRQDVDRTVNNGETSAITLQVQCQLCKADG